MLKISLISFFFGFVQRKKPYRVLIIQSNEHSCNILAWSKNILYNGMLFHLLLEFSASGLKLHVFSDVTQDYSSAISRTLVHSKWARRKNMSSETA